MPSAIVPVKLPVSLYRGSMRFADVTVEAHVLDDGRAAIDLRGISLLLLGSASFPFQETLAALDDLKRLANRLTIIDFIDDGAVRRCINAADLPVICSQIRHDCRRSSSLDAWRIVARAHDVLDVVLADAARVALDPRTALPRIDEPLLELEIEEDQPRKVRGLTLRSRGFVYAISCGPKRPVKIGFTGDLNRRLDDLQVGSPHVLQVDAAMPGYLVFEKSLHEALAPRVLAGEWFSRSEETRAVIEFMRKHSIAGPDVPTFAAFLRERFSVEFRGGHLQLPLLGTKGAA